MSDFMQRQLTGNENWLRVETRQGTEFIRIADTSLFVRNSDCISQPLTDDEREATIDKIRDYVEGTPESWENIKGYGARLSAPGYLDCTEWTVFDTREEAEKYLDENYPKDEEDDTPQMSCDQCQMLSINGVPCHETGCPNMNSRWDADSGEWIKQRKGFECGCTVDADDPCCSEPFEDEETQ
jgi:hypothetical protein